MSKSSISITTTILDSDFATRQVSKLGLNSGQSNALGSLLATSARSLALPSVVTLSRNSKPFKHAKSGIYYAGGSILVSHARGYLDLGLTAFDCAIL